MASNRLTIELRNQIAEKIFNATALPTKLEVNTLALKKIYKDWLISKIPEDFKQATKNLPKEWLQQCSRIEVASEMSLSNPDMSTYGNSGWMHTTYFDDPVSVPASFRIPSMKQIDFNNLPDLAFHLGERVGLLALEEQTKKSLKETLKVYNTTTKLIKDFPEFAKHCPDAPLSYPIAVNPDKVVHGLMQVGFDITVKPKQLHRLK